MTVYDGQLNGSRDGPNGFIQTLSSKASDHIIGWYQLHKGYPHGRVKVSDLYTRQEYEGIPQHDIVDLSVS